MVFTSLAQEMEALSSSKISGCFRTTRHYNPEDGTFHGNRLENLKSKASLNLQV
jgi:hypothetical protein